MKKILSLFLLACLPAFGQTVVYRALNTNQFGSNQFIVSLKSGVLLTNPVISGPLTVSDLITGSLTVVSNSWLNIPVLAEGDNAYASSNGTPYVIARYAGVQTTNPVGSVGIVSSTAFASSWNGVTTVAPSKDAVYDWGHLFDTDDDGLVNVLDTTFNSGSAFTGTTVAPNTLGGGQFAMLPTFVSGQAGAGLYVSGVGVGSTALDQHLVRGVLSAGYTGAAGTFAGVFVNASAGVGVNLNTLAVNGGTFGVASGTTIGANLGNNGYSSGGNLSAGVAGFAIIAKNSAQNVGVLGYALNTGTGLSNTAGAFLLRTSPTTIPAYPSAAIFADNGTTTSPIFIGADNGVTVFTIADGGPVTANVGVASLRSNLVAPSTITVTASPFSWTNPVTVNAVVYIDGISVTGTVGQNGTTIFNSIGQNTLILQPGEWTTITYTLGSPTATWKPF